MVSKKRLYSGFIGYRAPVIPRAPRSIRKRGSHKKLVEDGQLCAFELLAAVAGKLLLESESSASSSVAEGNSQIKNDKALKSESFNHGSFAESASLPNSDFLEKIDCDIKPGMREEKSSDENATCKIGSSNCVGESFNSKVESGPELQSDDGKNKIGHLSRPDISTVNDGQYVNTNGVTNPEAESSVKFPLYRESTHNNVKLGIRDDDENSFRCNKSSTKSRSQPRIIRHRMRKMMASKYRRATTKPMNYELYNTSEGMKSFFRYRKNTTYARERCERGPLKKRKLSDHNSFGAAFESSDSISNSPEEGLRGEMNSSVTFSIKSFKVPELYIEVPEAATVGSLKRTVMDAVAAIIGGGIRVGVVFQGKKVRDDHRTLQQAGISQCANLDNVGFILEPSFAHISPSKPSDKLPALSLCDADEPLPRSSIYPMTHSEISNASIDPQPVIKSDKVETNEFKSTPDNMLTDGAVIDSKALIPVSPPLNVEALAVVPLNSKPKRGDMSQRRTRRPFSVGEVEALVESVEKLGTGRWRDVKIRAFENADHRTYVDLKDKWKTLVHTASIAPQQRRGEPVPQELLDRVLSAHSYWLQHQSKQQGKHPAEPLKMVGCSEEIMGA